MLVGRNREQAALHDAYRTPGHALVVSGGAGMGKSRLLAAGAEKVSGDVRVVTGHCLPLSVDLPLLPIIDLLRELVTEDRAGFDAAVVRAPAFVGNELARLLPELGERTDGDAQRHRQFEAVRRLLAETADVAIVIDDLQWCDAASLDLLEYLIGRPSPAIVLAVRPPAETPERLQAWLERIARLPTVRQMHLGPLNRGEVRQLLEASGWSGTAERAASIARRSGGVPYYVEQLATLVGDGELPQEIEVLLQGRLVGLSEAARDVMNVLSVAGRPVTDEELEAACGSRTGDALRELAPRGLVHSDRKAGSPITRMPSHSLLAEAVLAQLTTRELRALHGRIAEAFAAAPEPDPDDVVRHLARAGDTQGEVLWRVRAADQARRRAAPREAYGHLARAIAIDPAANVATYLDAHRLARHAGDTAAAAALAERMLGFFEKNATDDVQMQMWHAVGHHRVLRDRSGLDALARAVEIGKSLPSTTAYGYVLYDYARHLRGWGDDGAALALDTQLSAAAETSEDPDLATLIEVERAWQAFLVGDQQTAARLISIAQSRSALSIGPGLNAAAMITDALLTTGRLDEAVAYGRRIIAERETLGLSGASVTGTLRADVAAALLEQGRVADAGVTLGPAPTGVPAPDAAASAEQRTLLDVAQGRIAEAIGYWSQEGISLPYPVWLVQAVPALLTTLIEGDRAEEAVRRGMAALDIVLMCDRSRFAGEMIMLVRRALGDLLEAGGPLAEVQQLCELLDARIAGAPVDPFATGSFPIAAAAAGLTDDAERQRAAGRSDSERWRRAGEAWRALGRPVRSGYCGWRAAQALLATRGGRPAAVATLQQASTEAGEYVPLRAAITQLAVTARIQLFETTDAPPPDPPGVLTDRELAVLRLVAEGLTNTEIGRALYISPKTAGVHITHILRKLGARTRVDAATRAQRAGLID